MRETHFVNAHGLTAANHYTSAYDLAVLGRKVSRVPQLVRITSTRYHRWNGHVLVNLNRPLFWYPGLDGLKPGYTDDAGICQLLDVRRRGGHVIVSLLNTPDLDVDARNLLNFGLQDFGWVQSTLPGDRPSLTISGTSRWGTYSYFIGSGHFIRNRFLRAFAAAGGLDALGYPRTEALTEGSKTVQYFENGALSRGRSGSIKRLAIGLIPVSGVTPAPVPTPVPGTPTPTQIPNPLHARAAAKVFSAYYRAHKALLGNAVSVSWITNGYRLQIFMYGALAYAQTSHRIYRLPIGDRLLVAHLFLPAHPGDVYPTGFGPASVLKSTGWLPDRTTIQKRGGR